MRTDQGDLPEPNEVEAAFDRVIEKLRDLNAKLPADERIAFMELIDSAKEHADYVQARDEGDIRKILYAKPIQVHGTIAMKEKMRNLPDLFRR